MLFIKIRIRICTNRDRIARLFLFLRKALEHAQRAIHLLTVDCSSLIADARSTPAKPSQNPSSDGPEASRENASSSSNSERPGINTCSGAPAAPPAEDCAWGAAVKVADVNGRVADDVSRERRSSHGRAGVLAVAYHSLAVQQVRMLTYTFHVGLAATEHNDTRHVGLRFDGHASKGGTFDIKPGVIWLKVQRDSKMNHEGACSLGCIIRNFASTAHDVLRLQRTSSSRNSRMPRLSQEHVRRGSQKWPTSAMLTW